MCLLRVALVILGLVSLNTAPAVADEHVVVILEAAYFPEQSVVNDGDVVRFVNASGRTHTVTHVDGAWQTLPLAHGEELLVTIAPDMTGTFTGLDGPGFFGRLIAAGPANEGASPRTQ